MANQAPQPGHDHEDNHRPRSERATDHADRRNQLDNAIHISLASFQRWVGKNMYSVPRYSTLTPSLPPAINNRPLDRQLRRQRRTALPGLKPLNHLQLERTAEAASLRLRHPFSSRENRPLLSCLTPGGHSKGQALLRNIEG